MEHKKQFVLLVAGGSGSRMGSATPKQFMLLQGLPVLAHTLRAFAKATPQAAYILVLPENQFSHWQQLCRQHAISTPHTLVAGGKTRFESVKNGLDSIPATSGLVSVHDGVRPLVTPELISNSFAVAAQTGSAVAAVPVKDSVRQLQAGHSVALDRSQLRLVQTPQVFDLALLRKAYAQTQQDHFTDDASVAEAAGHTITLIEGNYRNLKITTPEDLILAEALLASEHE